MSSPWAERMRPARWEDFVGQDAIKKWVQDFVSRNQIPNLLFVGPPGSGKSTLARLIRESVQGTWFESHGADFSASQMREIVKEVRSQPPLLAKRSYLLMDEVHRLSRTQQDHLLEPLETGLVTLVATTTENPHVSLSRALLSRLRVFRFQAHDLGLLKIIMERAAKKLCPEIPIERLMTEELIQDLLQSAEGDARKLVADLQDLVTGFQLNQRQLTCEDYIQIKGRSTERALSESHYYDVLSAFIKSIRGSDPDAALLWLAHMIRGGVDPRMIARRIVICASEDIGNADPRGLEVAINAAQAVDHVGLPEVGIVLSQAVIYLCRSPKSNSAYLAYQRALAHVDSKGFSVVPPHLTAEARSDYRNPQTSPSGYIDQNYRPPELNAVQFYEPFSRGYEKKLIEYMQWMKGSK